MCDLPLPGYSSRAGRNGPKKKQPAYTGEDVIIVQDEKIAALYVFLDSPPA